MQKTKTTNRVLSLVLAVLMVLSLFPAMTPAARAEGEPGFTLFDSNGTEINYTGDTTTLSGVGAYITEQNLDDVTIKLNSDFIAAKKAENFNYPTGKTITLDLNGFTYSFRGNSMEVTGNFTVRDSSSANSGKLTSHSANAKISIVNNSENQIVAKFDSITIEKPCFAVGNYSTIEIVNCAMSGNYLLDGGGSADTHSRKFHVTGGSGTFTSTSKAVFELTSWNSTDEIILKNFNLSAESSIFARMSSTNAITGKIRVESGELVTASPIIAASGCLTEVVGGLLKSPSSDVGVAFESYADIITPEGKSLMYDETEKGFCIQTAPVETDSGDLTVTPAGGEVANYKSVKEAFAAAKNGGTIVLQNDSTWTNQKTGAAISGDVSVDLNGHILSLAPYATSAKAGAIHVNSGKLVITDSIGTGKIKFACSYGITLGESGSLDINGGELSGADTAIAFKGVKHQGSVTITQGNVSATEYAIDLNAVLGGKSLVITGGDISGCVAVSGLETVRITGGTITSEKDTVTLNYISNPIEIGGDAIIKNIGPNADTALKFEARESVIVNGNAYISSQNGTAVSVLASTVNLTIEDNAKFEGGTTSINYANAGTILLNGGYFKFTDKPFADSVTVTYKADSEYTQDWIDSYNSQNDTDLTFDTNQGYYILSPKAETSGDYEGYYGIVTRKSLFTTERIGKDGTVYTATDANGKKYVFTYQYLDDLVNALKMANQKAADANTYTADSLAVLNTAIASAESIVSINSDGTFTSVAVNASQVEIDYTYNALMRAVDNLKGKSELDPNSLNDGVYKVGVVVYANGTDSTSMANGAVESYAQLYVQDGSYTLYVRFKPLYLFGKWGHLVGLETYSGSSRAAATNGIVEDVPVENWYTDASSSTNIIECTDEHDHGHVYNSDGSQKCYPYTVRLPLYYHSAEDNRHLIRVSVDMMNALGIGKQRADLAIQWDTLTLDHYFPSLQLDKEEVSVIVGDSNAASDTVAVTVQNADDYALSTESGNASIATAVLKDGVVTVTGVAAGETTVTVKLTNNSDSTDVISKEISVTVAPKGSKPVEVASVEASGGKVTATLTGDALTTNGEKGISIQSNKVCVNAASEDAADATAVVLPKSVAKAFADSGKPVEITTNVGIITLDSALLKQISETATKDAPAILSIEKSGSISTKAGNKFDTSYLLNLTVDGKDMDFGSGKATVSVPTELTDGTSAYAYQIKNGKLVDKQTATVAGGNAAWTTTHFSVWAISTKTYQTDDSGTQQSAYPDDGNYYVDMTLWKSATDEASMGSKAFELNPRALVTVKDGKITTVQFATNPVDLTGYYTAITAMTVNGEPVTVQETGDLTTIISGETGNDYKYIKRASFNLNTEAPAANEITYVPAHFTVPDTPMDLTMPDGMDARLKFTWSTAVATTDTELTAVEKAPVADGVYSVPVKMMNFTSPDKESMGNAALDGNAIVTVKDGKLTYSLNLKGVTIGTSFGHLLEMWSFADRDAANKLADPVLAAVTATYQDKDLNGGTSTFVKTVAIERSGDAENEIFIRVHVDAMEGFDQNAILVFDWDKAAEYVDPCADGHKTEVKNAKAATCTEAGYTGDEVCTVCGETVKQGETIAAKGHTWGEWKVTKAATTSAEGEQTRTCSVCGETETHKIPKLDVKNPFVDVAQGQYYYDPVLWAVNHDPQITNGTDATHFSPMATCTRGQVVTFLWRAKGCPEPKTTNNPFSDVKASDYYYKAVLWANENGITNGTSATTFSPNDPCTRAHVVTFLWRAENKPAAGSSNPFADVPAGQYYTDAVLWAVNHNPQITNGTDATHFSPDKPCTRGQVVTFLYRDMA